MTALEAKAPAAAGLRTSAAGACGRIKIGDVDLVIRFTRGLMWTHPVRNGVNPHIGVRAVRGKFCGRTREEIGRITSAWPGLARPSTPSRNRNKGVDARIKSAQDDLG